MSRTVIYLFLLFLFYYKVNSEKKSCTKLPNVAEPSSLTALRKKLKCKYETAKMPKNETTPRLGVRIYTDRNRMQYSGTSDFISSDSFFLIVWNDDRLKWKESDYKNHSFLYMRPYDIWRPKLVSEGTFIYPNYVLVFASGQVNLLLWWKISGQCKPTFEKWTDKRICTISFQLEPAEKLRLTGHYMMTSTDADKHTSWRIVDVKKDEGKELKSSNLTEAATSRSKLDSNLGLVTLELHLIRNIAVMDAALFSPAVVLFLLLLASTWIPCGESIRIAVLALTTLLAIFLMNLATKAIPTFPGRFSDFSVLYRDMVMVSGVAFFEWYLAYLIASKKISSAGRLQSLAATASHSSYAFLRSIFFIPSNPSKAPVENGSSEGALLALVLDRIVFVILLMVFIIVMIVNAHRSIEIESE